MKIAFTSCFRYEAFSVQPSWKKIEEQNPDYLFLLGDSIYMDYGLAPFSPEYIKRPKRYSDKKFEATMLQKYKNQFEKVSDFKNLVEKMRSKNGLFGIWDDHDFAWDNAKGALVPYEKKEISRRLFHKFLDCSTNLPHTYYHIDTPIARVIFIDNRTDACPEGEYAVLLSDEQFSFIEEKLNHNLEYTLICGGLTLTRGHENWSKYPSQLMRLCNLIKETPKVFFLSGDIHYNDFVPPLQLNFENFEFTTPPQLISSGLAINYFGLGIGLDDRHNWAILDLEHNNASITYYKKDKPQLSLSLEANEWINEMYNNLDGLENKYYS